MEKRNSGVIVAFLLIAFSVYVFFSCFSITSTANAALGPAFMPRVVSIILFVLGCANLWSEIKERKQSVQASGDVQAAQSPDTAGTSGKMTLHINDFIAKHIDYFSGGLLLVYVFMIKPLGFLIASALYMLVHMLLLTIHTKRNYAVILLLTIAAPTIIYFSFVKIFYLMLPPGILG